MIIELPPAASPSVGVFWGVMDAGRLRLVTATMPLSEAETRDDLRGQLRIGLQWDVEVTDTRGPGPLVTQAFCSALPVAYSRIPAPIWAPFARLVLEAAYEATLLAGVLNADRGSARRVFLTRLGGGAFGNDDAWIDAALLRACRLLAKTDLAVAVVSHRQPSAKLRALVDRFETSGSDGVI